jgi:hypothetical protein
MRHGSGVKRRFSILTAAVLLGFAAPSVAQAKSKGFTLRDRATYLGKPYVSLRPVLESSGWLPENLHGPYPEYPEIHCSLSGQCVAYWRRKDLSEIYVDVNVSQEPFIAEAIQSDVEYRKEHAN